jgi:polyphosphate glucokinase
MEHIGFGVDIGGSGTKGARVDLETGELASDRIKFATPKEYAIDDVVQTVLDVVDQAGWDGPFGCTFPGIVKRGVLYSAANLGPHWLGVDLAGLLTERAGRPVTVLNDADAAGLAELDFGVAKGRDGVVIVTTLGTGIGSALFLDGKLVPNTELGHLEIDGESAEVRASSAAKAREGLSYKEWAPRLQRFYSHVDFLFSPDLIVVGGGISRKAAKFLPMIDIRSEIVAAQLENQAGIAGAAMAAELA